MEDEDSDEIAGIPGMVLRIGLNETSLTRALLNGDYAGAERIIEETTDVEFLNEGALQETPLNIVLSGPTGQHEQPRNLKLAKLLLEKGANPNLRIPNTDLETACESPIELLLRYYLTLIEVFDKPASHSEDGTTSSGDVRNLYRSSEETELIDSVGLHGEIVGLTPQTLVAQVRELLYYCLERGGDPNLPTTVGARTIYHCAAVAPVVDNDLLQKLVDEGANVNHADVHNTTPLMDIINLGQEARSIEELDRYQLNHKAPLLDIQNCSLQSLLFRAAFKGQWKVVARLLDLGAKQGLCARIQLDPRSKAVHQRRWRSRHISVPALLAPLLGNSAAMTRHRRKITRSIDSRNARDSSSHKLSTSFEFSVTVADEVTRQSVSPLVDSDSLVCDSVAETLSHLTKHYTEQPNVSKSEIVDPRALIHLMFGQTSAGLRQLAVRAILRHTLFKQSPKEAMDKLNRVCEKKGITMFRMLIEPSSTSLSDARIVHDFTLETGTELELSFDPGSVNLDLDRTEEGDEEATRTPSSDDTTTVDPTTSISTTSDQIASPVESVGGYENNGGSHTGSVREVVANGLSYSASSFSALAHTGLTRIASGITGAASGLSTSLSSTSQPATAYNNGLESILTPDSNPRTDVVSSSLAYITLPHPTNAPTTVVEANYLYQPSEMTATSEADTDQSVDSECSVIHRSTQTISASTIPASVGSANNCSDTGRLSASPSLDGRSTNTQRLADRLNLKEGTTTTSSIGGARDRSEPSGHTRSVLASSRENKTHLADTDSVHRLLPGDCYGPAEQVRTRLEGSHDGRMAKDVEGFYKDTAYVDELSQIEKELGLLNAFDRELGDLENRFQQFSMSTAWLEKKSTRDQDAEESLSSRRPIYKSLADLEGLTGIERSRAKRHLMLNQLSQSNNQDQLNCESETRAIDSRNVSYDDVDLEEEILNQMSIHTQTDVYLSEVAQLLQATRDDDDDGNDLQRVPESDNSSESSPSRRRRRCCQRREDNTTSDTGEQNLRRRLDDNWSLGAFRNLDSSPELVMRRSTTSTVRVAPAFPHGHRRLPESSTARPSSGTTDDDDNHIITTQEEDVFNVLNHTIQLVQSLEVNVNMDVAKGSESVYSPPTPPAQPVGCQSDTSTVGGAVALERSTIAPLDDMSCQSNGSYNTPSRVTNWHMDAAEKSSNLPALVGVVSSSDDEEETLPPLIAHEKSIAGTDVVQNFDNDVLPTAMQRVLQQMLRMGMRRRSPVTQSHGTNTADEENNLYRSSGLNLPMALHVHSPDNAQDGDTARGDMLGSVLSTPSDLPDLTSSSGDEALSESDSGPETWGCTFPLRHICCRNVCLEDCEPTETSVICHLNMPILEALTDVLGVPSSLWPCFSLEVARLQLTVLLSHHHAIVCDRNCEGDESDNEDPHLDDENLDDITETDSTFSESSYSEFSVRSNFGSVMSTIGSVVTEEPDQVGNVSTSSVWDSEETRAAEADVDEDVWVSASSDSDWLEDGEDLIRLRRFLGSSPPSNWDHSTSSEDSDD